MENNHPLISADELHKVTGRKDMVILDASMASPLPGKKNEIGHLAIPGARHFDFETIFCDQESALPHAMPSASCFEKEARKLGINNNSYIVVYDNMGIYSSPRAWWMFKAMGHDNIAVLDGGLPHWTKMGYATESKFTKPPQDGDFCANYQPSLMSSSEEILQTLNSDSAVVLDARSASRYLGQEPEPRAGVRRGHMPGAANLHFRSLLEDGKMKSKEQLQALFAPLVQDNPQKIAFTCGSGVTACILALGAAILELPDLSVYDGSWSEWGADESLPVTCKE